MVSRSLVKTQTSAAIAIARFASTSGSASYSQSARAAAKALSDYEQDPEVLARRAMQIASEVCVFTNDRLTIEVVE